MVKAPDRDNARGWMTQPAAWSAEETPLDERKALPSAEFVRRAIDICWDGGIPTKADDLLRTMMRMMPGDDEQPIFKSPLNDYFIEPWLLKLGLSCVLDPQVSFGLQASAAALDFHRQLFGAEAFGGSRPPCSGRGAKAPLATIDARDLEEGPPPG